MVNISSKRINVKGLDIHYYSGGQGEPLIIVHGGGEGAKAWRKNIKMLSRKYKVYAPDLPGFGSSQSMLISYSVPVISNFIEDFANAIGLKTFHLMGHSFGGGVAAHYALKHPQKIRKLVLVSSLCLGKEIAWWIRLTANPVFCQTLGRLAVSFFKGVKFVAKRLGPWEMIEPVTKTSIQIGGCISNFTTQTIVLLKQLPEILVPTLLLWGANDPIVPSYQAYAAAQLIPNCKVKVFESCGHSVYRDNLRAFSKELTGFLG